MSAYIKTVRLGGCCSLTLRHEVSSRVVRPRKWTSVIMIVHACAQSVLILLLSIALAPPYAPSIYTPSSYTCPFAHSLVCDAISTAANAQSSPWSAVSTALLHLANTHCDPSSLLDPYQSAPAPDHPSKRSTRRRSPACRYPAERASSRA